ncbi:membrane protein [Pasteurella multocida]|nr:CidA/LrgA family protein [Pasteurella dagmatis]SNV57589.1 membrane protein [Pasteurella dagmatis]VEI57953.1 membrane protein [Pasteurella multocida]
MARKIVDIIRSLFILYAMLWIGGQIAHFIPIGIPASIWGLLLLFLCLTFRIIKLNWVLASSNLLIRYMALLFVPVSVGIVKYADLLFEQMKVLLLPNIISTFLTLIVIGFLSDYIFSLKSFAYLRKKAIKRQARK